MKVSQPIKFTAVFDEPNHRFIISPLRAGNKMEVPAIFRIIKRKTHVSWRWLAKFAGLDNQSKAFRVAYVKKSDDLIEMLSEYMVIDVDRQECYFYDFEHKPDGVAVPHTGPSIKNGEPKKQNVTEKIPTKVTSRLVVEDPLNRSLTMSLTPTGGYLLGIRDIALANPNMTYVVSGTAVSLNRLLKQIHFVGMGTGEGNVVVKVDDRQNEDTSICSTTVSLKILEGEKISVPALNLPDSPIAVLNEETPFDPISVEDEDGKIMEFRITPFGCDIVGFKNYLKALHPGEVRNVYGRPETINEEIANLAIIAKQENAQIGVELICGKTQLREYVAFLVGEDDAPEQPTEPGRVDEGTADDATAGDEPTVTPSEVTGETVPPTEDDEEIAGD